MKDTSLYIGAGVLLILLIFSYMSYSQNAILTANKKTATSTQTASGNANKSISYGDISQKIIDALSADKNKELTVKF